MLAAALKSAKKVQKLDISFSTMGQDSIHLDAFHQDNLLIETVLGEIYQNMTRLGSLKDVHLDFHGYSLEYLALDVLIDFQR